MTAFAVAYMAVASCVSADGRTFRTGERVELEPDEVTAALPLITAALLRPAPPTAEPAADTLARSLEGPMP